MNARQYVGYFSLLRWPFFLSQMRYVMDTWDSPYRRRFHRLVYMTGLILSVRLVVLSVSSYSRYWKIFRNLSGFINHLLDHTELDSLFDPYLLLCFFMILLSTLLIYKRIYSSDPKGLLSWEITFDNTVTNYDQFFKNNTEILRKSYRELSIPAKLEFTRVIVFTLKTLLNLWKGKGFTFGNDRMKHFPKCSNKCRTRALLMLLFSEVIANFIMGVSGRHKS